MGWLKKQMIKKTLILLSVFIFCAASLCAELIFLKDGTVIKGKVGSRIGKSIVVRTDKGWQTIDVDLIDKIELDYSIEGYKARKEKRKRIDKNASVLNDILTREEGFLDFRFGPKIGFFYFDDSNIKEKHKFATLLGANAILWLKQPGIQVEVENYSSKYTTYLDKFQNGYFAGTYKYTEKISITPFWTSFLIRNNSKKYVFAGIGVGFIMSNIERDSEAERSRKRTDFFGHQFLLGAYNNKIGFMLKYTRIESNNYWDNVDLGGFSFALNVHF
jgi:hypothetical protein